MAMQTVILEAFEDQNGTLGLGLRGMRNTHETDAALEGILIAHDIVEHVNGFEQIGSIDDELEALGAIWFVRGQYWDLTRDGRGSNYTPQQNIASDIVRMFRDFFYGAPVDLSAPRTRPCEADADLKDIIREALKSTRVEVDDEDAETPELARREREFMRVCLPRMRMGYRKAARKYKDGRRANALFWAISKAVDPCCKHLVEGMQYELHYGFDSHGIADAYCVEHFPEDDYSDDE